jgi:predicted dehydrogenase
VIAHFDSGLAMPGRRELEVVGSSGVLRVANPWHPEPDGIELWGEGAPTAEVVPMPSHDSYALQVADLSAAARGEHTPLLGRDDAVGQARTLEALYASAAAGSSVSL